MIPAERRAIQFIKRHLLIFVVIFATVGTLYVRYCLRDVISGDMSKCLLPWFEKIQKRGGMRALGKAVGNYNVPYQVIIAIFTYLPFRPEYMYKGLSIIFDYLLAWAMAQLIYDLTKERVLQAITYIVTVSLPIVILNSAAWGQCDSIYSFFCVLSMLFLFREKYLLCFISFGVAYAFKLQAVFLLPFLMFVWFYKERFSVWHFVLIPVVNFIMCLPGIIAGRGLKVLTDVYAKQMSNTKRMAWNYPAFWTFLQDNQSKENYYLMRAMAILTVMLILLVMLVLLMKRDGALSLKNMVEIAFIFVFTCVFFLPSMHERYSYLYIILGIAVAVLDVATLPAFMCLLFVDLQTYGLFLFLTPILPWTVLTLINLAVYVFYIIRVFIPMVQKSLWQKGEAA